jgi:hypothetical protein
MHAPISEVHAQWHWCLQFRMRSNCQRFHQFHPTVMLVAYVNSCFIIIRQAAHKTTTKMWEKTFGWISTNDALYSCFEGKYWLSTPKTTFKKFTEFNDSIPLYTINSYFHCDIVSECSISKIQRIFENQKWSFLL